MYLIIGCTVCPNLAFFITSHPFTFDTWIVCSCGSHTIHIIYIFLYVVWYIYIHFNMGSDACPIMRYQAGSQWFWDRLFVSSFNPWICWTWCLNVMWFLLIGCWTNQQHDLNFDIKTCLIGYWRVFFIFKSVVVFPWVSQHFIGPWGSFRHVNRPGLRTIRSGQSSARGNTVANRSTNSSMTCFEALWTPLRLGGNIKTGLSRPGVRPERHVCWRNSMDMAVCQNLVPL